MVHRARVLEGGRTMASMLGEHCMYARALGPKFRALPWAVRRVHADHEWRVLIGRVSVRRGKNWWSRFAAWLYGFPPELRAAPCRVEFTTTPRGERWWRRFGGHPMSSVLSVENHKLYETFGLLKVELVCAKRGGTLVIESSRARFCTIPMPRWLSPDVMASEKERAGEFSFRVSIRIPAFGLIAAYHGTLTAA